MLLAFGTFTIAAILIVLLPGPDTLVVVRGMVRGGRRGAALTALGVLSGLCCWVAAAALGLAALLKASEVGYEALKIAGAAYLIWIGVQSLRSIRKSTGEVAAHGDGPTAPADVIETKGRSGFAGGFLTDILNPKVGVFFVSFLPGFVPDGASVGWTSIAFGAIFVLLTALYFVGLIAVSGTIATWMQTPHIRRRLDAVTGVVLIGFGVRLATE
ncbi:LysE family translocator [Nocardioides sp. Kera G14]|uniref:LysE family translocator n=1 Tax=Nocardioides sp. Kera G14 TaxID=2884264 RepID=UPI001D110C29|nr:LysE family translocator [Nocardioides sp. Kera G14]UDY23657.1 LysE family translocator [Nocardioides sp. Kera G14]